MSTPEIPQPSPLEQHALPSNGAGDEDDQTSDDTGTQDEQPTQIELDSDSAQAIVSELVDKGIVSWPEVAAKILQSL